MRDISSNFPDTRVVNWNRAYYFWGEAQKINSNVVASIELSSKTQMLTSKSSFRKVLRGTKTIFDLPQLYTTSAVKRDLVFQASSRTEDTFFVGMIPDVFSSVQILFNEEKYIRIGCPLTLVGTSPKSTGASQLNVFYMKENDYINQGVNCKSTANRRTSLSLLASKSSIYFLMDSLFDYLESAKIPDNHRMFRMGFGSFLSSSYLRLDYALNKEIRLNLKTYFSKSIFDRLPVYGLSILYLCFIPPIKFIARIGNFFSKRYIAPLDYKLVSYQSVGFPSIQDFIDSIPKDKVKYLPRF
jgi:hypothetical protein